jgi:transcriptional regulator with PAS, ATPase and Fis domain
MTRRTRPIDAVLEPVLVSGAMKRLDGVLRAVADKDVVVCLIGESGSGKDVIARRIHQLSPRRAEPFAPINCAAIPEALFESELFGHERGAFTGATQLARGKIEAASGGSLFLDEIGELPLPMQAKLLRFLENRRFTRVGGTNKIEADVRPICATHHPLDEEVRRGTFRADLFYRIQVITLFIPPLRERKADLVPLVHELLAELTHKHRVPAPKLEQNVLAALRNYSWPGNVRELRNVVEQLCLLFPGKKVKVSDLPLPSQLPRQANSNREPSPGMPPSMTVRLDRPLQETVDDIIAAAVALDGGNRSAAARRLGIGLRTVQRRLSDGAGSAR